MERDEAWRHSRSCCLIAAKSTGQTEQPRVAGSKRCSKTSMSKVFVNSLNISCARGELTGAPSPRKIYLQYRAVHWVDNTESFFICSGSKMEMRSPKREQ